VAATAWLGRTFITDRFARAAKEFEFKLKADADREVEGLRSSLQMVAVEHQVRFSNLHEERAKVIADLYTRLVILQREAERFVFNLGKKTDGQPSAFERVYDFYCFVDERRIYFPEHICRLLEQYDVALRGPVVHAHVYGDIEYPNHQTLIERNEGFKKSFDAFKNEIPTARRKLEEEFRLILGAS